MLWFLTVLTLFGSPAMAEPCTPAGACGLAVEAIPDFTLTDVNPNSPSFEQEVSRDSLIGEYLIIYFSQAT